MTDPSKRILIVAQRESPSVKLIEYLEAKQHIVLFMSFENAISETIRLAEPDIVVLDLGDGEYNCASIRSIVKWSNLTSRVPVICFSGKTDLVYRLQCLRSGANDFLLKPICLPELLARIYVQLELVQKLDAQQMQSRMSELVHEATPGLSKRQLNKHCIDGLGSHEIFSRIETMLKTRLDDHPKPAVLAQEIGCSLKQLNDLFRKKTGKSISAYTLDLKMTTACKWLTGSDLRINEIGKRLGYEHPGDFTRAFTRRWSTSPRQYRQTGGQVDKQLAKPAVRAETQMTL